MLWPQESEKVLGGVLLIPYSEFQSDLLFLAFDLSLHPQRYLITLSLSHTFSFSVYLSFIGHCFGRFQGDSRDKCILSCSNEKSSKEKLFEPLGLFLNC